MEEELMSVRDVAAYLGISHTTIHNYIKNGLLVPDLIMPKVGSRTGRRKFKRSTVENFKKSMEVNNGTDTD